MAAALSDLAPDRRWLIAWQATNREEWPDLEKRFAWLARRACHPHGVHSDRATTARAGDDGRYHLTSPDTGSQAACAQPRVEIIHTFWIKWWSDGGDGVDDGPAGRADVFVAADYATHLPVGEGLAGLATSAWASGAADLVIEVHGRLSQVAEQAGDPALTLLVDTVGCVALFAAGRIDDAVGQAVQVDRRAVDADNLMAVWIAAGSPTIAALLTANPTQGIPWVNRLMRTHLRLGTGAGGSFIETRANFAAQAGSHAEAARLYGAAYTETRRAGKVWPRRPLTTQLITVTRGQLSRADYEGQWQAGEQLTMAAVVDE